MNSFRKLLNKKQPQKTGNTRNVKDVWFLDSASPVRLYPGDSLTREYLEQYSQIVEIIDVEQQEVVYWDGKVVWEDK